MTTKDSALSCDVVVIGGGPGGATSATLLADQGKTVLLLEREKFPRYHIGESLLSGTTALLEKIGVEEQMERAGFVKKHGVEWVWGKNRTPWTVYFKDALATPYNYGYQVERSKFDKLLLDNAVQHGVMVKQECEVREVLVEAERVIGLIYHDNTSGRTETVHGRWVIDASGQGGVVTNKLCKRDWDPMLKNMAVWSYWKNAKRPPGIDNGNTFLPTFNDGWWWFIPLQDEITSVGVVVDREKYQELIKLGSDAFYKSAIERTPELAARLSGAVQTSPIRIQRDWSYQYDRFCAGGFFAVGDAACFIDPLFSTGVHLAMLSGYLAATCINTLLDNVVRQEAAVFDFYQRQYEKEFGRLKEQVYFLYSGHAQSKEEYFWKARTIFANPDVRPEKAFISLIAGSFEHRSWYHRFIRQLDVPSDLRDVVSGIFDGSSAGPSGIGLTQPLKRSDKCVLQNDFAIRGAYLHPTQVIRTNEGYELAVSDAIQELLDVSEGRTGQEIIDLLAQKHSEEHVRNALNQVIAYGVVATSEMVAAPAQ